MSEKHLSRAAEGYYQSVQVVCDTMLESRNQINTLLQPNERETALRGSYLRGTAWMQSLDVLNAPRHVQAIVAAHRALIEIVVDAMLLHHDDSGDRTRSHTFWEESAKLKAAEGVVRYFTDHGRQMPAQFLPQQRFVQNNAQRINQERQNLGWVRNGRPYHPDRWTTQNLGVDTQAVDQLQADPARNKLGADSIVAELGSTLEEHYETEYRRINWLVHGSGLAFLREADLDQIERLCALTFGWCADLATICMKTVLTDYGFARHMPGFDEHWAQRKAVRRQVVWNLLHNDL